MAFTWAHLPAILVYFRYWEMADITPSEAILSASLIKAAGGEAVEWHHLPVHHCPDSDELRVGNSITGILIGVGLRVCVCVYFRGSVVISCESPCR